MTIICAISTLIVNSIELFPDCWILKKIWQNYLTIKYSSELPVSILGQTSGHTYLQST